MRVVEIWEGDGRPRTLDETGALQTLRGRVGCVLCAIAANGEPELGERRARISSETHAGKEQVLHNEHRESVVRYSRGDHGAASQGPPTFRGCTRQAKFEESRTSGTGTGQLFFQEVEAL